MIVLLNGRTYDLGSGFAGAAAILEAWLPGETTGDVIADVEIASERVDIDGEIHLSCTVRNTGERVASETVPIALPVDMLSMSGSDVRRFVEPGELELMLGTSPEAIVARITVTVVSESGEEYRYLGDDCRLTATTEVVPRG